MEALLSHFTDENAKPEIQFTSCLKLCCILAAIFQLYLRWDRPDSALTKAAKQF